MRQQQITVSLSKEELEQIEQYAASRGIKKATAVKELAIRGLELTTNCSNKNKELVNLVLQTFKKMDQEQLQQLYFQQQLDKITLLINEGNYLQAINLVNELKQHTDREDILKLLDKAANDIKFYESSRNISNYLNKRNNVL